MIEKGGLKIALLISLIGGLLVGSLFFYLSYLPNRKIVDGNTIKIKEINQEIALESAQVKKIKDEIISFNPYNTHLNYFNRLSLSGPQRIPYLLKDLTREANALGIKFISIDPKYPEDNEFYQKYLFIVEVRAAQYPELLHFLDSIENKLKLNIHELTIQPDENFPSKLIAKISLNSMEMKDDQLKKFDSIEEIKNFYLDSDTPKTIRVEADYELAESEQKLLLSQAVERNPFTHFLLEASLSPSPKIKPMSSEKIEPLMIKRNDQELALKAIMNFQGEFIAILGQEKVKKGEILKNTQVGDKYVDMKVIKVEDNSVTIGDGEKQYTFKLPDNPITFK